MCFSYLNKRGSSKKSRYVVKYTPSLERKSKKSATVQSTRQCKHTDNSPSTPPSSLWVFVLAQLPVHSVLTTSAPWRQCE